MVIFFNKISNFVFILLNKFTNFTNYFGFLMDKKTRIGILTSGGDAPGMNAAIRACVRACVYYNCTPLGIKMGYQGLISELINEITARDVGNIINKGGTILKSVRCSDFKTKQGRDKAYENIKKFDLDKIIVIGGDGSFRGAKQFEEEYNFPIIGIPGTIDNDISGTDYTIGFDTATNTVISAIDKIRDTASSHNRLFFIEVMGRDSGFIALNTGIGAGAEEILIPEENLGIDRLIKALKGSSKSGKKSSIVVVSEGDQTKGVFNLLDKVKDKLSEDYEIKVTILGHIQRGGSPTCFDRVLASRLGVSAVEMLLEGKSYAMVGVQGGKIKLTNLDQISRRHEINKNLLRISEIISI